MRFDVSSAGLVTHVRALFFGAHAVSAAPVSNRAGDNTSPVGIGLKTFQTRFQKKNRLLTA